MRRSLKRRVQAKSARHLEMIMTFLAVSLPVHLSGEDLNIGGGPVAVPNLHLFQIWRAVFGREVKRRSNM